MFKSFCLGLWLELGFTVEGKDLGIGLRLRVKL